MISTKGIPKEEALTCVGVGWAPLVERFYAEAGQSSVSVVVLQVKEKFGGLRIYWASGDDTTCFNSQSLGIDHLIDTLRVLSTNICEICGVDGKMHMHGGWMKTSCNNCYDDWIKKNETRRR